MYMYIYAYTYIHTLLTKRKVKVKVAGYWPSSLFAFLWTERKLCCGNKTRNPYGAVSLHLACSGSESQCGTWFILPLSGSLPHNKCPYNTHAENITLCTSEVRIISLLLKSESHSNLRNLSIH